MPHTPTSGPRPPEYYLDPAMRRRIEVVDSEMAEILRRKTSAERLAIANDLWCSARDMLGSLLRSEHPDWTQDEVERAAARRLALDSDRVASDGRVVSS